MRARVRATFTADRSNPIFEVLPTLDRIELELFRRYGATNLEQWSKTADGSLCVDVLRELEDGQDRDVEREVLRGDLRQLARDHGWKIGTENLKNPDELEPGEDR